MSNFTDRFVDLDACSELFEYFYFFFFFFQAEDGIRDAQESRGLGDVYKRQYQRRVRDNSATTTSSTDHAASTSNTAANSVGTSSSVLCLESKSAESSQSWHRTQLRTLLLGAT
eukprot:TRINITY_DN55181_c0_g1_i2.p2 TRINITY_DN55181_c0_g1~~TRINITY_DN55181_c0_g1_i2.p2  ORF type:complete len:114 (+),score=28.40 TRINITY_DN55181_c0_g1_i2:25-366(+)